MPLKPQYVDFINAYLENGNNITAAAKAAGYAEISAAQQGSRIMKRDDIRRELARRAARIERKSELNAEKVMSAMNSLMDFDVADCYGDDGKPLPVKEMPLKARRAIHSIDGEKIKFVSPLGVIELSAKLLNMLKQEQVAQAAVQIIVQPAPERPAPLPTARELRPEFD